MSRLTERSITHFRMTQGPLRCLSPLDPCNRNKQPIAAINPSTQTTAPQRQQKEN